jgi:hypothetical protein
MQFTKHTAHTQTIIKELKMREIAMCKTQKPVFHWNEYKRVEEDQIHYISG